jgi:protein TonB
MATTRDRSTAAVGACLFQALMLYAFLNLSLDPAFAPPNAPILHFITLPHAPDPPPLRLKTQMPAPAAAPKPPAHKADPSPIVVPPPVIPLFAPPPPLPTAPIAGPATAPAAGAAPTPGPGTSGGGTGTGAGTGGDGDGGSPAEWLRGRIRSSDYPPEAAANGMQGGLRTRYTIGINGRITDCSIAESSGNPLLDQRTCDLAIRRYRYRPARDATGRPVIGHDVQRHHWIILGPGESPPPPETENPR